MERCLLILPESMEEALVAAHVMTQYMMTRVIMGRDTRNVTIVCPLEQLHPFVQAEWIFAHVVKEATEQQVEEAHVTFQFDTEKAYWMTKEVQKDIAESLGIQLGVGLWSHLPTVFLEDTAEEAATVLVAERNEQDGTDDSWQWPWQDEFQLMGRQREIPMKFLPASATFEETRQAVAKASVVVGVRGTATLIAVAGNKRTMELQPDDKCHPEWFRKTRNTHYRMAYGSMEKMEAEFIWKHVAAMVVRTQPSKPRETETVTEDTYATGTNIRIRPDTVTATEEIAR